MRVRFWGTRGSIARPGPTTLRYGGNTSCVELQSDGGTVVVLDCGTGVYGLGKELLDRGGSGGHLLISHTHWDHIQGFPFFSPLFVPSQEWDIYAPSASGDGLERTLRGQMEYTYFPVRLDQLSATIRFHDLGEGAFELGDLRVTSHYLNHPAVTLGYRLEAGGVTVVYSTDHEPHSRIQAEPDAPRAGEFPTLVHGEDARHAEFLAGADLVIHDTQYTAAEYEQKIGWGHSTFEYVVDAAVAAGVKRVALFHHDPERTDAAVEEVLQASQKRAAEWDSPLEIFAAQEGAEVKLSELAAAAKSGPATLLIVDDDPGLVQAVSLLLEEEGYRVLTVPNGSAALDVARKEHPDLVVLDWLLPGMDGLEVCRALRGDADPAVRHVPVVMLTALGGSSDTQAGFAAGVSDYLTKPFTPAHMLSRIKEWLARSQAAA